MYVALWVAFGMFGIVAAVCFMVRVVLANHNEHSVLEIGLDEEESNILIPDTPRQWGSERFLWDNVPETGIRVKTRRV